MKKAEERAAAFELSVFINCPFDSEYLSLLRPLLFTIVHCGFHPRIASERSDSSENRIDKILELIRQCRYGIHDLSRLKASEAGEFARLNMPFELGTEYGARIFGNKTMKSKRFLILEKARYDFARALSDLSGVDIKSHNNEATHIVRVVRNWFAETNGLRNLASGTTIWYRFNDFTSYFHESRKEAGFSDEDLNMMPVPEYIDSIRDWVSSTHK